MTIPSILGYFVEPFIWALATLKIFVNIRYNTSKFNFTIIVYSFCSIKVKEPIIITIKIYSDKNKQGGGVAAPTAQKILSEVLPYLEVSQDNLTSEDIKVNVEVPNVIGLTYKEAKKTLEDAGLKITMREDIDVKEIPDDFTISNQVPSSGVQVLEGGSVIVE